MRYALDVDYRDDGSALAAAVGFPHWDDAVAAEERTVLVSEVAGYVPGAFYRRELPCLRAVLGAITGPLEFVLVDGHVWLRAHDDPGLGAHLWESLGRVVPVIGVAKQRFAEGIARPLLRGTSASPLWITAAGIDIADALTHLASMHGANRIPTLLKRVDSLCRGR